MAPVRAESHVRTPDPRLTEVGEEDLPRGWFRMRWPGRGMRIETRRPGRCPDTFVRQVSPSRESGSLPVPLPGELRSSSTAMARTVAFSRSRSAMCMRSSSRKYRDEVDRGVRGASAGATVRLRLVLPTIRAAGHPPSDEHRTRPRPRRRPLITYQPSRQASTPEAQFPRDH